MKSALSSNLLLVRERLGLSQKAVGERLGVSGSLVSKWEKGERTPDEAQLWELARAYGVSAAFLREGTCTVHFQPRSLVARGGDEKHEFGSALNDAAEQIHSLHRIWETAGRVPQRFALALEYSEPMLPELTKVVREYLRLNERVSYGELREALAEKNVLVFEWKLPAKMSGLSYQRDFSVIFVNRGMPERVKLFTLCHELAHLLFHLRGDCETEVSVMATRNDPHEKQANRFAAELLMPGDKLDAVIRDRGAALRTKPGFFAEVERFGVSPGALFYRLAQRNVVRYAEKGRLFVEQARPDERAIGARVDCVEKQLPAVVLEKLSRLWLEEKISIGKAAEWCMAKRSAMEAYLANAADDGAPVEDIDLGYGEVEGMVE